MDVVRHRLGFSKTVKRFPRKDTCPCAFTRIASTRSDRCGTRWRRRTHGALDWEEQLTALCRAYVEAKLEQQVLDYDDLLLYWHAMTADPALAAAIGSRFDHVLVDEYQDTNVVQAEILLRFSSPTAPDSPSSVMTRSRFDLPCRVDRQHPRVSVALHAARPHRYVEENYQPDAARPRRRERVDGQRARGSIASACTARSGRAAVVRDGARRAGAGDLRRRLRAQARERGVDLRRQAVLKRNADHSDVLELELMRRNIPYVKYGGLKFLEAAHVKDLLSRRCAGPTTRATASRPSACCSCCPAWAPPMHSA